MNLCTINGNRMEFSTGIYRTGNRIIRGLNYEFQYHVFSSGYIMSFECSIGDWGWMND